MNKAHAERVAVKAMLQQLVDAADTSLSGFGDVTIPLNDQVNYLCHTQKLVSDIVNAMNKLTVGADGFMADTGEKFADWAEKNLVPIE